MPSPSREASRRQNRESPVRQLVAWEVFGACWMAAGSPELDFGQFLFQQLLVIQVVVVTVQGEQLVVGAQFHNLAAVQDGDTVGMAHGGHAVRDEDGGSAPDHFAEA